MRRTRSAATARASAARWRASRSDFAFEDDRDDDDEDDEREGAAAPEHDRPPAALQPRGADEDGAPAARAPLAGRVLGEAAVGAGALHLTSVDIVTGYRQAVPVDRFDPGLQPSGRPPAPGRLGLVQAFLNTFWDLDGHGAEVWSSPEAYARWLGERGFAGPVSRVDLDGAILMREALRSLALANHDDAAAPAAEEVLDRVALEVAPRAGLIPRFGAGGDRLEVAAGGPDAALALVLGIVFGARANGSWRRMKACPHEHCGWVFYDRSRNRSSQWCSMRICGNRTKAARHRALVAGR